MKIAITGGAGFIGRELIWELNSMGYNDITIIDSYPTIIQDRVIMEGLSFTEVIDYKQILIDSDFKWVKKFDFIFHLGANSSTRSKISEIYDVNFTFSVRLFLEARWHDVPVVFASSGAIYGSDRRETSKPNPLTAYGYTKMVCENMIKYFPELYDNIVCLRYHNVYGASEGHKGDMSSIVYKWISGQDHKLFQDSKEIKRDFIHVSDINYVNIAFMRYWILKKTFPLRIYDVGTGKPVSFLQLGNEIKRHTKKKITYIDNPYNKSNYQFFTKADITDLKEIFDELGEKYAPMSIKQGIEKVYNDFNYIC